MVENNIEKVEVVAEEEQGKLSSPEQEEKPRRSVSSSTIIRRFTQALIRNHDILFNNVSGQETSWVKMADARFIYGPVGRQLLQGWSTLT